MGYMSNLIPDETVYLEPGEEGGWEATLNCDIYRAPHRSIYATTLGGDTSENALKFVSGGAGAARVTSDTVKVVPHRFYKAHAWVQSLSVSREVIFGLEFFDTGDNSVGEYKRRFNARLGFWGMGMAFATAPATAVKANLYVEAQDTTSEEEFLVAHPAMIPFARFVSPLLSRVLDYTPDFLLEEDLKATDDLNQMISRPMARYFDIALTSGDTTADDIVNWHLVRQVDASDGTERLSSLGDPDQAKVTWLPWLAQHLGITFTNRDGGNSPWIAFQDGGEFLLWDEWEAIEMGAAPAGQWVDIETYNQSYFGAATQYRRQITSGYNGILAGRTETMYEYLYDLLDTEDPHLTIKKHYRTNPFKVGFFIPTAADPDPGGSLLYDAAMFTTPGGVEAHMVYHLWHGGSRSWSAEEFFDDLGLANSAVPHELTLPFVPCNVGSGRHITLGEIDGLNAPFWGGGIGPARWYDGYALYSGGVEAVTDTLDEDTTGDMEVRVLLSDLFLPTAPPSSRFVCGVDGKWGLYFINDGTLHLEWYNSSSNPKSATSTVAIPWQNTAPQPMWLRVSLYDSGADQKADFYWARSQFDDEWTKIGDTVTVSTSNGVKSSTAGVRVLAKSAGGFSAI
jgi:hypothetical protein